MRDLLNELGLGADPVVIDDQGLLWLAPACDNWAPIVDQHELSAVIDLEAGLDTGIPAHPDQVIYVYFPFKDGMIMGERLYLDVNSITGQVAPVEMELEEEQASA